MSSDTTNVVGQTCCGTDATKHELDHLRSGWRWFSLMGILLVVCGTIAIIFPIVSSVAAIIAMSVVLMIAGFATIIGSFLTGKWGGFFLQLLVGILYVACSFIIMDHPIVATIAITLAIALAFIVLGAFRTIAALMIRFPQWGWAAANGVITFVLGVVIYRKLPEDALWVIGLLVGIEMLLNGWTWIMLSLDLQRLAKEPRL